MSNVQVQLFDEFAALVSAEWLRDVASVTLSLEADAADEPLSLVIADDASVIDLNARFRGLDESTDVLSFSYDHAGRYYGVETPAHLDDTEADFVLPPDQSRGIGEVVISYPQAARQASAAGRQVETELASLVAHGIFHLLGYDHEEDDEAEEMRMMEERALQLFRHKRLTP